MTSNTRKDALCFVYRYEWELLLFEEKLDLSRKRFCFGSSDAVATFAPESVEKSIQPFEREEEALWLLVNNTSGYPSGVSGRSSEITSAGDHVVENAKQSGETKEKIVEPSVFPEIVQIHVDSVQKIYPLTSKAYLFLKTRMEPWVRIENALYEDHVENYKKRREREKIEKSIRDMLNILELPLDRMETEENINAIVCAVESRFSLNSTKELRLLGESARKSMLRDLVEYECHTIYRDEDIQYFYQMNEMMAKKENKNPSKYIFSNELNKMQKKCLAFSDLLNEFNQEEYKKFKQKVDEIWSEDSHFTILLFLYYKNKIQEWKEQKNTFDFWSKTADQLKTYFAKYDENEAILRACALLGAFFYSSLSPVRYWYRRVPFHTEQREKDHPNEDKEEELSQQLNAEAKTTAVHSNEGSTEQDTSAPAGPKNFSDNDDMGPISSQKQESAHDPSSKQPQTNDAPSEPSRSESEGETKEEGA